MEGVARSLMDSNSEAKTARSWGNILLFTLLVLREEADYYILIRAGASY